MVELGAPHSTGLPSVRLRGQVRLADLASTNAKQGAYRTLLAPSLDGNDSC
jgi:hypothetical protein